MPVILTSQEAESRRTTVRGQPGQIVCEHLSQKLPTNKRARGMAQEIEHLPSTHEARVQTKINKQINK
jgi:hypothetical protein